MSAIPKLRSALRLRCSACGATAEAACDCGVAYMPPRALAAEELAKDDSRSNREISESLGISHETVRRARQARDTNVPVEEQIAQPFIALADDFLTPADADRTICTIAQYLNGALLDPPPGIRLCLVEAMGRATPGSVKAIIAAADFLSLLRSSVK